MKMRRANKEVKNWNEIMEIIRRSETIRLGTNLFLPVIDCNVIL
mgnify:CR=1 FL=1